VAKTVICPSCQSKGSIPDGAQVAKIRCPKCGQTFDVKAATQTSSTSLSATTKRPASGVQPKRPAAAPSASYADLENAEPMPQIGQSTTRRSVNAGANAPKAGGNSTLFAILGIGGAVVGLLLVLLVVVLTRGGGDAGAGKRPAVAEASAPSPAEPVATPPPAVAVAPAPSETASPSAPTVVDGAEIVRRLKEATVYIKNKIGGKTLGSGTGFVIEVRGEETILATNRHVAVMDISHVPAKFVPEGAKPELEVVFRSGQGAQKEQAVAAEILAYDASDDFGTDLAILRCKGVRQPPKPINYLSKSETTEGMTYTGAGFPLGGMLGQVAEGHGNPSVTITGGRIAALRPDDSGQLALFQVDGSLQPGNSGGPIVEEKTGKLIGVAVAKVGAVDTIGFVVPAEQIRRTLDGRIGYIDLTLKALQTGSAHLQVKTQIVDPRQRVGAVALHVAPGTAGTVSPNGDGTWPPLPNSTKVDLQRDPKVAMASGEVQVALSGQGAAARKVLIQTAHKDVKGKLVYSKPREYELPAKPGHILPPGQFQRTLKSVMRKSFSLLAALVDPDKDCKLVKDEDSMKLKIEVPGNKIHTLAPYVVTRLNKKKPLHNAPMALTEVEGDVVAIVKVTGEMKPGSTIPKDRQGNTIPFTFNGAGLVLYQDKENFVRIERTAGVSVDNLASIHKFLFEVVKDGKHVENQAYVPLPEGDVTLILIKRKGKVRALFSPDDGRTIAPLQEFDLDLPAKVKVGLTASNISAKPFTATFEDFAVINDTTLIDAQFGDSEPPPKKKEE
jgi:S1-C subfamily serine protease/regulation of enolase protein 1 (concanavalin A-like superfamily)